MSPYIMTGCQVYRNRVAIRDIIFLVLKPYITRNVEIDRLALLSYKMRVKSLAFFICSNRLKVLVMLKLNCLRLLPKQVCQIFVQTYKNRFILDAYQWNIVNPSI